MKSLGLTILLCFLVLARPDAVFPEGRLGKLPLRVASALGPDSDPAWIDAESVVDQAGKLDMNALPAGIRLFAERQIQNGDYQKYGCISFGTVAIDRAGPIVPHSTFKDLTQSAKTVLKGAVTSVTYGFTVYGPSSLVEIQVDDWLKKSAKTAGGSFVYLVYPVAEFKVGGYRFCKTDLPQWGKEPKPGDQVLLFPYQPPIDDAGLVFLPDPDGYEVILGRKGNTAISIPKSLKEDPDILGVKDIETLRKRAFEYIQKSGVERD